MLAPRTLCDRQRLCYTCCYAAREQHLTSIHASLVAAQQGPFSNALVAATARLSRVNTCRPSRDCCYDSTLTKHTPPLYKHQNTGQSAQTLNSSQTHSTAADHTSKTTKAIAMQLRSVARVQSAGLHTTTWQHGTGEGVGEVSRMRYGWQLASSTDGGCCSQTKAGRYTQRTQTQQQALQHTVLRCPCTCADREEGRAAERQHASRPLHSSIQTNARYKHAKQC